MSCCYEAGLAHRAQLILYVFCSSVVCGHTWCIAVYLKFIWSIFCLCMGDWGGDRAYLEKMLEGYSALPPCLCYSRKLHIEHS